MSVSYAKRTRDMCFKQNITLIDYSTLREYRVTLSAPKDHLLLFAESGVYTHVEERKKGSRKEPFWYRIFCTAEGGIISEEAWKQFDRVYKASENTRDKSMTFTKSARLWFPPPPAI